MTEDTRPPEDRLREALNASFAEWPHGTCRRHGALACECPDDMRRVSIPLTVARAALAASRPAPAEPPVRPDGLDAAEQERLRAEFFGLADPPVADLSPHESNHHGWGGPCRGCAPCPHHGVDCPAALRDPA